MKIFSYNVNGIRAAIKKGFLEWLDDTKPDIVCIQESKAQVDQIPTLELLAMGYESYWHSAQKKGYSGVGILTKIEPKNIEIGCGIKKYDDEGRIIRADFDGFSVISTYFPSGSSGDIRQDFKYEFLDDFFLYIDELKKKIPNLIIAGDYNICHTEIDIHNPKSNADTSGFLPQEREWMTKFIESGFVDSFRCLNQQPHHYSWWSYRANARNNNKGWRIDYNMISKSLESKLERAYILPEAKHSDHCPVSVELSL